MHYNITKEFLTELHDRTKDIPKLEYIKIILPVYKDVSISGLRKYFKDFAIYEADIDDALDHYTYKNIKFVIKHNDSLYFEQSQAMFYVKFLGSSPYRILDTLHRNSNFTISGFNLPFNKFGVACARALVAPEHKNVAIAMSSSETERNVVERWFTPSQISGTVTQSEKVIAGARSNELAVLDVYDAFLDTSFNVYVRMANYIRSNPAFNVITAFDTYFARSNKELYFRRQLRNINYYNNELNEFTSNIFPISQSADTRYENIHTRGDSANVSSFLLNIVIRKPHLSQHDITSTESSDMLFTLLSRLPYNMLLQPLSVITKPTNDVEYFSKAIPDINLFYILQDKYIDLRSAVIASFAADLEAYLKSLHNQDTPSFFLSIDYITHHYNLADTYSGYRSSDLYERSKQFWVETVNNEIRRAVNGRTLNDWNFRVMDGTFKNVLMPILVRNNGCSMCRSQRNSIDYTQIPTDVAFKYDSINLLEKMFYNRVTETGMSTVFGDHKICEHCKHNYDVQFNRYNGFWDNHNCFIGPDSVPATTTDINFHVNEYDYRPHRTLFIRTADEAENELHLGVELEIDDPDYRESGYYDDDDDYVEENEGNAAISTEYAASMFIATLGKGTDVAYAMSDGSLNFGFEIATMPATLKAHLDPQYFDYAKAFAKVSYAGFRSHDTRTCGIHVHMDRSFFGSTSQAQLYRAALMAYILERNWQEVSRFSRRRIHNLDQWAKKKNLASFLDTQDGVEKASAKFLIEYDNDKYVMLNTMHRHSFELRIFRGTLNLRSYLATLQFVDNLSRLVLDIDVAKAQQITFKDIINYAPHPELVAYVTERFGENYLGEWFYVCNCSSPKRCSRPQWRPYEKNVWL